MKANRGSGNTGGGSSDQGDGGGGMRAPSGGGTQRQGADQLESRTDRGNQNDEDIGSSASRGVGGGEANVPRRRAPDLDPTPDTPDITGTTDALGG
jgi:hypothetical protein